MTAMHRQGSHLHCSVIISITMHAKYSSDIIRLSQYPGAMETSFQYICLVSAAAELLCIS